MLAMLHVQLTHRLWRDAHALGAGGIAEIGRFPDGGSLTGSYSYYGTCTRIARIIAIQYMLDMALDHNLEGATRYAALLRQSFSLALSRADLIDAFFRIHHEPAGVSVHSGIPGQVEGPGYDYRRAGKNCSDHQAQGSESCCHPIET
ncbi:MAG: hypothetical protein ACKO3F_03200 [Cyanobium sp.]